MKKKSFLTICILVVIGTFAAMNINLSFNRTANDLLLTNIEALAQGEDGPSGCHGTGTVVCNGSASYYGKWY